MLLPSAQEAAAWWVATARAAIEAGARLDEPAVRLLMALAPADPIVAVAIERVGAFHVVEGLAAHAHAASAQLREAAAAHDEALARAAVTGLENEVLRVYRPAHGLGLFEDDVAVALAMLDAYEVGGDDTHLMMAEELLIGVTRRYWSERGRHSLDVNCETAVALARLAELTGKPEYRDRALDIMRGYAPGYREHGVDAAPYVSALQVIS